MIDFLAVTLICTGMAPTTPRTNVEIEIRPAKFSTIRYEIAEGSLAGTAYIQSIGRMQGWQRSGTVRFLSDSGGPKPARLEMRVSGNKIARAYFYHYSSGMHRAPVECEVSE
jgi:hypothetical protein